MKRSITYLLVFVVLFFVLDFVAGIIMATVFPKIEYGTYGKINRSLVANEEVLIFGSSRAAHHYDPEIISYETGMTSYNTGLGGYGLLYNYALFNEIVKSYKPTVVLLDLSPNVIIDPKTYSKLNIFSPYYHDYPSFNEIIRLDPDFSSFKTFFKLYVYNSTLYDLVRNTFSKNPEDGYISLKGSVNAMNFVPMQLTESNIDSLKYFYLEKFLDTAIQNNIRLICVVSPTYEKFDVNNEIIDELNILISEKGVEFHDYSNYKTLYQQPEYFKDQLHLNSEGADIFSHKISEIINKPTHE